MAIGDTQNSGNDDWFSQNAPTAAGPTDDQLQKWFQQYVGRPGTDAELAQYRAMPNAESAIMNSPDGIAYLNQQHPELGADPGAVAAAQNASKNWTKDWFTSNVGTPNNMQDLLAMQGKIEAAGGKLNKNASGQWNGKITDPSGKIVDVMIAAGEGGKGFQWDDSGGSGGTNLGNLLEPFTEKFTPPGEAPKFTPPPAFAYGDFQAPTAESVLNEPGYAFREGQGIKGILNSRAASGSLRGGNTLRDLVNYNQGFASNEYGQAFDRSAQTYGINRGNAVDTYNTNYKTQYVDPYSFDTSRYNTARDNAWQSYLHDFDVFKYNHQWPYTVLSDQQRIGAAAAQA